MSVYKYINNTATAVSVSTYSIAAWGYLQVSSRIAVLEPYVNNPLTLLIDGVEFTNYVEATRDSTGNTLGLSISGKDIAQAKLTNEVGMKLMGLAAGTGAGDGNVWYYKSVAPGDYDAVQVVIEHGETSSTTTYTAIVASTETILQNTAINRWRPVVGGTERSALNAVDQYGWKTAKFAGASSIVPPAASGTAIYEIVSDWIPLASVTRTDGSSFPATMVRVSNVGGTISYIGSSNTLMDTPTAANGGFIMQVGWDGDATGLAVSDPANHNPSVDDRNAGSAVIGLRYRLRDPGISILTCGDSLTQNASVVADGLSSVGLRVAAAISNSGIPCGIINCGFSSQPMDVYATACASRIANWKPNMVVVQGFSPNGPGANYTTDAFMRYGIQEQSALVRSQISAAKLIGAATIITTGIPSSSTIIPTSTQDAYRLSYNTTLMSRRSSKDTVVVDFSTLVSNTATPARIATAYDYGDAVHVNELGVALQATTLLPVVKNLFGIV